MRLSVLEIIIIKSLSYLAITYNIIIYCILPSAIVKKGLDPIWGYYSLAK